MKQLKHCNTIGINGVIFLFVETISWIGVYKLMSHTIIIFGNGYVSRFLTQALDSIGWKIYCTSRKIPAGDRIQNGNVTLVNFLDPSIASIIKSSSVILSTVPPNQESCTPALDKYANVISKETFAWIGYLSATSVYGDHQGNWVNEETECVPSNAKAATRLLAEKRWMDLHVQHNLPVHILRLSGIYGPNNNCLQQIINGKDSTILNKGQYFSRIHVSDICRSIIASIGTPSAGEIFNISDDEPTPISIVQQFGADILKHKKLKEIPFASAKMSEQAKAFFLDNKKVSNHKIKTRLNLQWQYPNYRSGLVEGCLPYLNNHKE